MRTPQRRLLLTSHISQWRRSAHRACTVYSPTPTTPRQVHSISAVPARLSFNLPFKPFRLRSSMSGRTTDNGGSSGSCLRNELSRVIPARYSPLAASCITVWHAVSPGSVVTGSSSKSPSLLVFPHQARPSSQESHTLLSRAVPQTDYRY